MFDREDHTNSVVDRMRAGRWNKLKQQYEWDGHAIDQRID
eukprot:SAG22_NODE_1610_length_4002_cov_2.012298_4_plen_40_part_00